MPVRQPRLRSRPQKPHPTAGAGRKTRVQPLHTSVQGRARFGVPGLYRADEHTRNRLENGLAAFPPIKTVHANTLTGNLLILFEPEVQIDDIIALIERQTDAVYGRAANAVRPAPTENGADGENVTSLTSYRRTSYGAPRAASREPGDRGHGPRPWHTVSPAEALNAFATSASTGLGGETVAARLARYGPNRLPSAKSRSDLSILTEQFMSLPVGLLAASAVISVATGGALDAAVIMGVVVINAGIGYATERQAEQTIGALAGVTPGTASVLRAGAVREIPAGEVVPGDILMLTPGMHVAADARLLHTNRLGLDESALTGESMPVTKSADFVGQPDTPIAERKNVVYMGTLVTGGSGFGVVTATGIHTELGAIQSMVGETRPPATPMQRQLDGLGTQLALLSGAVCTGVFGVGLARGYGWLEMLKASISLAVAAVPEGLPAVATTTLAMGIQDMRKRRVAIRHLDAVETLGAVQVFCLDKTGTLTLNRMAVVAAYAGRERIVVTEGNFYAAGKTIVVSEGHELLRLFQIVALCSEAELDGEAGTPNGSATENALLATAIGAGVKVDALRREYPRLKIEYRSEGQPYMHTLHASAAAGRLIAVKGSPTEVLSMCRRYLDHGQTLELDETVRDTILLENENMAGDALRVLGVACAQVDRDQEPALNDLVWLGLVGLADPVRTGMDKLMDVFHRAGIRTVMITGDQSATAYAIGKQLNLSDGKPLEILDAGSLDKIDAAVLAGLVKRVHIFARVSPAHKLQIVQALQRAGRVVAMTGDGINDGPALKAADIGVAMGRGGTEVARSVADVVLQDDELDTMVVAVSRGRTIYGNIRKTIHFLLATNFTEIEVMLAGIAFNMGQPLRPMQLLWINLISDIFPGLALSLETPEPDILERPPRDSTEPIIRRHDLRRIAVESGVISAGTLASYGYALLRYGPGPRASTQAFTTLTVGQLLHAISCRSDRHSIFSRGKRPPNRYLNLALGGSLAAQLLAAVVPSLRRLLGTTPLGLVDGLIVGAGATLPLLINEASKQIAAGPDSQDRRPAQTDINYRQEKHSTET